MWPTNTMPVMPYPAFYVGRYASQALEIINEEKAISPTAELEENPLKKLEETESASSTNFTLTEKPPFTVEAFAEIEMDDDQIVQTQSLEDTLSELEDKTPATLDMVT